MDSKVQIKVVPRWWKYLPLVGTDLTLTRYPNIYLPHHVYQRWLNRQMTFHDEAMLIHETVHLHRQKEKGVFKYQLKYMFNRQFRLHEELVAIKEQMKFLKQHAQTYEFDRKAKQFASMEYFWMTSREEGKILLEQLWSQI